MADVAFNTDLQSFQSFVEIASSPDQAAGVDEDGAIGNAKTTASWRARTRRSSTEAIEAVGINNEVRQRLVTALERQFKVSSFGELPKEVRKALVGRGAVTATQDFKFDKDGNVTSGRPLTARRITAVVMALLGCGFVSGLVGGDMGSTLPGILLGIGSGICYGSYTIFSHYNLQRYDAYTSFFWSIAMAGVVSLIGFNGREIAGALSCAEGVFGMLGLVVFGTVLPFLTYTVGLTAIESGLASVIANVEPVTAALLGIVLYHEELTLWTLVGILFVLGAAVLLALGEKKPVQEAA